MILITLSYNIFNILECEAYNFFLALKTILPFNLSKTLDAYLM